MNKNIVQTSIRSTFGINEPLLIADLESSGLDSSQNRARLPISRSMA